MTRRIAALIVVVGGGRRAVTAKMKSFRGVPGSGLSYPPRD